MTATSFFTSCKYINASLNSRIKGMMMIHCVVPENIHTLPTERNGNSEGRGVQKTQFPRGWGGWLLEVFFRELRVRLVSYQKLTAALLSKFSVISLLTVF